MISTIAGNFPADTPSWVKYTANAADICGVAATVSFVAGIIFSSGKAVALGICMFAGGVTLALPTCTLGVILVFFQAAGQ